MDFTIRVFSPPPLPVGPTLVSPASGDRSRDNTPLFQWQARSEADFGQYRLRVTTNDFTTGPFALDELITGNPPPTQFQTPPGKALADGTYLWSVRAETAGGESVTDFTDPPFVFTVDSTLPGPPALLLPVSGEVGNDNTPFFKWTPSPGAVVDYLLQVTSGGSFNPHLQIEVVVTHPGTGHQTTAPLNDSTYRWRVIAQDVGAVNTASSETRVFTVDIERPGTPRLVSPLNNAFLNGNTPTFDWDAPPAPTFGPAEDWGVTLEITVTPPPGVSVSGAPGVFFGVRPFCTDLFEFTQTAGGAGLACDVPRSVLLPPAQLEAFFDNPGGGEAVNLAAFDNTLLGVSRYSPGAGDVTFREWPLRIDLGTFAPVPPGTYTITVTWANGDFVNIPNTPTTRDVVLLEGPPAAPGLKVFDFRTGTALGGGWTCNISGGTTSCSVDVVAASEVRKDFTIRVAEPAPADYRLLVTSGDINTGPVVIDVVVSGDTTEFQVPTGDSLADAIYQWQVIARDEALNTAASVTRTFTMDTVSPGAPPLNLPASGDFTNDTTPFFDWDAATGNIQTYQLLVSRIDIVNGPFDIDESRPPEITEFQVPAGTPLLDGTYQWRVIATDQGLNTASSVTRTFTIDTDPPFVILVAPPSNALLSTDTPFFEWFPGTGGLALVEGGAGYRLLVTSADILTGPFDIDVLITSIPPDLPPPQFQVPPADALADGIYQWQVIVTDRALNSGTSDTRTFTVALAAVNDWTGTLTIFGTGDNGVPLSRGPDLLFGTRPFCTDLFESFQKPGGGGLECDVPRNIFLSAQVQAFFENPGGLGDFVGFPSDNTLLTTSRFAPPV